MSEDNNQPQEKLVNIGGLWVHKDKNGNPYFTGYLGNAKLYIFKNTYKEEDKHPDFVMSVGNKQKPTDEDIEDVDFYN